MKPAWDQLADAFKSSKTSLIVDVDCTKDASKDLCSKMGVRGYPTIKYFTSSTDPKGDDYSGGRDFDALKKFADENLGPSCSPTDLDLCDEDSKAKIAEFQAMDLAKLEAEIAEKAKAAADAEAHFKAEVQKLQDAYQKLTKEKDEAVKAAAVDPLMRAVVNAAAEGSAAAKDEL